MIRKLLTLAILISAGIGSLIFLFIVASSSKIPLFPSQTKQNLTAFSSSEDFSQYIQSGQLLGGNNFYQARGSATAPAPAIDMGVEKQAFAQNADRVSGTNVQVKGIDEPDIVKTDGKNIYFSPQMYGIFFERMLTPTSEKPLIAPDARVSIYPPQPQNVQTHIINAFPPTELEKVAKVDEQGELLLENGKLLVLSGDHLTAFDVSDSKNPKSLWKKELDGAVVSAARLAAGNLILITQNYVNIATPCPLPLFKGGITVPCERIYHPSAPFPVDSTYTVSSLDFQTGNINSNVSFVGSAGSTVIYVSPNAVYTTYSYPGDYLAFYHTFLTQTARDLIPDSILKRLGEIKSYDISSQSKLTELQLVMERHRASLGKDEALRIENELQNRLMDYSKAHARDLETTGIVKVNLQTLAVAATGSVPGHPLNQFALDEYEGNLRIATTSQGSFMANTESVNDVYVLDNNLQKIGEATGLATGETIYSARFINNQAYLVTFKQIDPFFVLDLSNPRSPKVAGELKIPGVSSYLHPIAQNRILGVGQEDGRVKLSLFDVSNPNNPTEIAKYSLNEYWTEVSSNHHAFLQDEKYGVFFLPGGNGGYIFSYQNNTLTLVKAVADIIAKRAIYLNNYLYIIGEDKIVVLSETDWQKVNEIKL